MYIYKYIFLYVQKFYKLQRETLFSFASQVPVIDINAQVLR